MLLYPVYYYVLLMVLTLAFLLLKDRVVRIIYRGRRPNRLSNSPQYLFGYVATHWVMTYVCFWTIELIWRTHTGNSDTYYGFILAMMETSIRSATYFVAADPGDPSHPTLATQINRYNYVYTSILVPMIVMTLDYLHA